MSNISIEVVYRPDLPESERVTVAQNVPVPEGISTIEWTLNGPAGSQFDSSAGVTLSSPSPLGIQDVSHAEDLRTWALTVENQNTTEEFIFVSYLLKVGTPSTGTWVEHDPSLVVVPDPTGSL